MFVLILYFLVYEIKIYWFPYLSQWMILSYPLIQIDPYIKQLSLWWVLVAHHVWWLLSSFKFFPHYINFKTFCKRIWATARQHLTYKGLLSRESKHESLTPSHQ